jgi:hypothetical protein
LSTWPSIIPEAFPNKAPTINLVYSSDGSSSNDPEARVSRPLQAKITNEKEDGCDGYKQTGASSNVERSGVIRLYNTVTLGSIIIAVLGILDRR